jgi:hypothetical protein
VDNSPSRNLQWVQREEDVTKAAVARRRARGMGRTWPVRVRLGTSPHAGRRDPVQAAMLRVPHPGRVRPAAAGPTLAGVYGRKPGSVPGYQYTPDFAKANFVWDDAHLDQYLTNPQALIPESIMPYRQSKAPVRQAIIAYLKEQPK